MADGLSAAVGGRGDPAPRPLPGPAVAREWLEAMLLIRRFEERAGEMYAKAKIGGFLHLAIGEEATIVGAARALRDDDYLVSTYRSHGHALARGTSPDAVMAELFGRVDGCSRGRGGSVPMFDLERRFMGGYRILRGHLPLAARAGPRPDHLDTRHAAPGPVRDGASQQGAFRGAQKLAAPRRASTRPWRSPTRRPSPSRRRCTTTSTCSGTRSRAGTRSTSARPGSIAARTRDDRDPLPRGAEHGAARGDAPRRVGDAHGRG